MMNQVQFVGCNRGMFGLGSWDPPRRPHPETLQQLGINPLSQQDTVSTATKPPAERPRQNIEFPANIQSVPMLAKYTYAANKETPLGHELNVTQGDNLKYLKKHDDNENWWLAENADGELGYVPASYMMKLDTRPSALPWLQKHEAKEPVIEGNDVFGAAQKPVFKPYQSSYAHEGLKKVTDQYYCDVCSKQLNGPKPYGAHMASKAHKEELEIQAEYAQNSLKDPGEVISVA